MTDQHAHLLLTAAASFVKDGSTHFVLAGLTQRGHGQYAEMVLDAGQCSVQTCCVLAKAQAGDYLSLSWHGAACTAACLD